MECEKVENNSFNKTVFKQILFVVNPALNVVLLNGGYYRVMQS